MLISTAMAASGAAADAPGAAEVVGLNVLLIVILVILFYVLLIMPQQKRFKEHRSMLDTLKKGDRIVISGGLLGKVHKIKDEQEIVIDLGNDIKVTALRSAIQSKVDV